MVNKAAHIMGERYGLLTVTKQLKSEKGRSVWECVCDCGNKTKALAHRLKNGSKRSCGCLKRPNLKSIKKCGACGRDFTKDPRNTWAYWEKARFCSSKCFGTWHAVHSEATRKTMAEEFIKHFDTPEHGCWEWKWLRDKDGYGLFPYAKTMHRAPRVALALDGRPVKKGWYACHTCDNPSCVRPSHLYPGTPTQNAADAMTRGRVRKGEKVHSSKLTEATVRQIRRAHGTHKEIAERFQVSRPNVCLIRARKTWKHVE